MNYIKLDLRVLLHKPDLIATLVADDKECCIPCTKELPVVDIIQFFADVCKNLGIELRVHPHVQACAEDEAAGDQKYTKTNLLIMSQWVKSSPDKLDYLISDGSGYDAGGTISDPHGSVRKT